jgi:penicillin-binding protein 1C
VSEIKEEMTQKRKRLSVLIIILVILVSAGSWVLYTRLPDYSNAIAEQKNRSGYCVLDRNGEVLRVFPDNQGNFAIWTEPGNVPKCLKDAIVAAEDKRFYQHMGFDAIAVARAAYNNISQMRIVSGASTISEQVVRLIHPRPRTYKSKLVELVCAVKLETQLKKEQILELYVNLSPMGRNIKGVGLASRTYFGKSVGRINASEAAVLAVLPRSPAKFDPRFKTGRERLVREKDKVLNQMAAMGNLSESSLAVMEKSEVPFRSQAFPLEAPHFVDLLVSGEGRRASVKSTLDLDLQHAVENILQSHRSRLARLGITQAGILVASVPKAEVLTLVGSMGYGATNSGYVSAVKANRGAGSILKPFLYALALERGYGSTSQIADTFRTYSTPFGDYQPYNADRKWYGPVSVRIALGNSLNIPAVKALKAVGVDEFYEMLDRIGLVGPASLPADHYGLGLAIGNLEVNLFNLVQAYTIFAADGRFQKLKLTPSAGQGFQAIDPGTAYVINHILADQSARLLTFGNPVFFDFGFPVALKTGTSSNYRDCWMVAFTSRHIVGIWAGNFDGRSVGSAAAASAAGPIMKDIMNHLYAGGQPEPFQRPLSVQERKICWMSGKLATPKCPYVAKDLILAGMGELETCDLSHENEKFPLGGQYAQWLDVRQREYGVGRFFLRNPDQTGGPGYRVTKSLTPIEIVSPHDHDRFLLSRDSNRVLFRAVPDPVVNHVTWIVDGMELGKSSAPYEFTWAMTKGSHTILAVTPANQAAKVTVFVE